MTNHTLESHEAEMPNCSDPDCEFHHPEVREDCCDGTGWTGNPYERCTTHYELFSADLDYDLNGEVHE